jgi:hypothetical protein
LKAEEDDFIDILAARATGRQVRRNDLGAAWVLAAMIDFVAVDLSLGSDAGGDGHSVGLLEAIRRHVKRSDMRHIEREENEDDCQDHMRESNPSRMSRLWPNPARSSRNIL